MHVVDVVGWIASHFAPDDYVVLKMDVEGAEHKIVHALAERGVLPLIDVFAIECHNKRRSPCYGNHTRTGLGLWPYLKHHARAQNARIEVKTCDGCMPREWWAARVEWWRAGLRSPACTQVLARANLTGYDRAGRRRCSGPQSVMTSY